MRSIICLSMLLTSASLSAKNMIETVTDPMTDAKRGIAIINFEGKVTPVVKCDKNGEGSIYISMHSKKYLGAGSSKIRDVKVRFDGAEPYTISAYHDKSSALILPPIKSGKSSGRLLTDMMSAKNMVIELKTYEYESITDTFPLDDAGDIIKKAIATCGDTNWMSISQ